jgi:hypothetical protein
MKSKEEIKLCKKAHNWPSLETLKNLVKNEESSIALPPKEIQAHCLDLDLNNQKTRRYF